MTQLLLELCGYSTAETETASGSASSTRTSSRVRQEEQKKKQQQQQKQQMEGRQLTFLIYRPSTDMRIQHLNDPVTNVIPTLPLSCDPSNGDYILHHVKKVESSLWEVLHIDDIQTSISNRLWLFGTTPSLNCTSIKEHSEETRIVDTWWWKKRRTKWFNDVQDVFRQKKTTIEDIEAIEAIENVAEADYTMKMRRGGYLLREMASGYLQLLDSCTEVCYTDPRTMSMDGDPTMSHGLEIETQLIAEDVWKNSSNKKKEKLGTKNEEEEEDASYRQLLNEVRLEVQSSVSIGEASEDIVSSISVLLFLFLFFFDSII